MLTFPRPVAQVWSEPRSVRAASVALILALLAGTGCSKQDGVPVFPVRGQVKFKGEPASGAFVVFHPVGAAPDPGASPVDEQPCPSALVKPDGSFELTTRQGGDGAPAGDYAVTLEWFKPVQRNGAPEAGPNVIPPTYGKPESTPLKVTVKAESNDLPAWEVTR